MPQEQKRVRSWKPKFERAQSSTSRESRSTVDAGQPLPRIGVGSSTAPADRSKQGTFQQGAEQEACILQRFEDKASDALVELPKIHFPSSLTDSTEGTVLLNLYRGIVLRFSNRRLLSRERAFYELLHFLATEAGTCTFPANVRPIIASEITRLGRSDFFNDYRRLHDERMDKDVADMQTKDLYAMRNLGTEAGLFESRRLSNRIINVLNVKRKSLHPPIWITSDEAVLGRSPLTAFPTPLQITKEKLEALKKEEAIVLAKAKSREHESRNECKRTASVQEKTPFDGAFNMGRNHGFGPAYGEGLFHGTKAWRSTQLKRLNQSPVPLVTQYHSPVPPVT